MVFAYISGSKASVTQFQFSEYGKRQNYASKRLRQLAVGPFQLNGLKGGEQFSPNSPSDNIKGGKKERKQRWSVCGVDECATAVDLASKRKTR